MLSNEEYTSNWDFPGLVDHNPNCSLPSDKLLSVISTIWPSKNGKIRIPYGFSFLPFQFTFARYQALRAGLHPEKFGPELKEIAHANIKWALNNWSKASNNTIEFYEVTSASWFSPGIYFYQVNQEHLIELGIIGATESIINNNGNTNNAFIIFPDSKEFWVSPPFNGTQEFNHIPGNFYTPRLNQVITAHTLHHEIGHALGFSSEDENMTIIQSLMNIPDGVYCSVMPYQDQISTSISRCNPCRDITNINITCNASNYTYYCNPPYAVYPGSLDRNLIEVAYQTSADSCLNINGIHYAFNILNSFSTSTCLAALH